MTASCAFAELKGHRVMFLSFDAIYLRHCSRFQSMTKDSDEHTLKALVFRTTHASKLGFKALGLGQAVFRRAMVKCINEQLCFAN